VTDPVLPSRTTACPSCGAALRLDAGWCGQCYHDLRPAPVVEAPAPPPSAPVTATPAARFGVPAVDPLTQPLIDFLPPAAPVTGPSAPQPAQPSPAAASRALPTWTCQVCQSSNVITELRCGTCGGSFLGSDGDQPLLVLPGVGDVTKLSRGQRLGLAGAVLALVLVPLAVLTLLLTQRPPAAPATGSTPSAATSDPAGAPVAPGSGVPGQTSP
jgi:hypothetical protein